MATAIVLPRAVVLSCMALFPFSVFLNDNSISMCAQLPQAVGSFLVVIKRETTLRTDFGDWGLGVIPLRIMESALGVSLGQIQIQTCTSLHDISTDKICQRPHVSLS